jgi:hypothetical protein
MHTKKLHRILTVRIYLCKNISKDIKVNIKVKSGLLNHNSVWMGVCTYLQLQCVLLLTYGAKPFLRS